MALSQAVIGSIIPPRERGRYSGYMAATMAVATVSAFTRCCVANRSRQPL